MRITAVVAIVAMGSAAAVQGAAQAKPAGTSAAVPFVGCASDGQMGPAAGPATMPKGVTVKGGVAAGLAYYATDQGMGVLAPQGWHCFGTYGSSGTAIYVTPGPLDSATVFALDWKGVTGPGVVMIDSLGDTSGRFEVAKVIARVFPAKKAFAEGVIQEGLEPASDFPFGPYPGDKLTYKSGTLVEYVTAGGQDGLGTAPRVVKDADAIAGMAMLAGEAPDLILLAVRGATAAQASAIVAQAEADGARP